MAPGSADRTPLPRWVPRRPQQARRLRRRCAARLAALERAAAEAELRLRGQGDLMATVSHEMREPLNGILGMARLLAQTPLSEEQSGYLAAVLESGEMLLTLVNDLLDLSRVEAGRLALQPVDFALDPFLERIRLVTGLRAEQRGLRLVIERRPGTAEVVRGDPARLRQVLLNLLGNALKFTEEGEIRLTVSPEPAPPGRIGLRFEVTDTGIGIAEEALARLARPFFQAGTGAGFGGSGLGLVIARRLVEAMEGRLEFESRPGAGTVVRATVRLLPARNRGLDTGPGDAALAGAALLVVDRQKRSRQTIRALVESWGLVAREAGDAERAWLLLHEAADRGAAFDYVVIARDSVRGAAEELAQRIRAAPRLAHARLVMLAAAGLRGDAARAKAAGFDAFLPKPVSAETLFACLARLRSGRGEELVTAHSIGDHRGPRLRVLVADDNPVNLRLLSIMLERAGHEVTTVADGQQAVAAVAAGSFDLVLMDLQMPTMGGLEAARRIRALEDPAKAAVPIVAVTANAMEGEDARCRAAGMTGYLTKPVERARLLDLVARSVGSARARA